LKLEPGDLFLITSDGVIETLDLQGREFGIARLESILLKEISSPLPQIAQNLLSAVNAFGKQADDQTILLFRVQPFDLLE
jgi:serine phosphatase RsbU (regulator of sigma subunit)